MCVYTYDYTHENIARRGEDHLLYIWDQDCKPSTERAVIKFSSVLHMVVV